MRALVALVILGALVAAVFALGLLDGPRPDDRPQFDNPSSTEPEEERRFDPLRTGLKAPAAEAPIEEAPKVEPTTEEIPKPEPADDTTILALEVYDRSTGKRIEGFHYVLIDADRPRQDERVEGSQHELPLENGRDMSLSIEAKDFMPQSFDLRFATGEHRRVLRVQLDPAGRATGITLFVTDSYGQAITAIDVKTEMRGIDTASTTELRTLWQRNTENEKGEYAIPDLAPGHYRFTVQAMLDQRLFVPALHPATFYGSEALEPRITLRDGGQIDLQVFDLSGQALGGQDPGKEVSLRLRQGEKEIPIAWRSIVNSRSIEATGILPAAATCSLAHPIEPGTYLLDVRRAKGAPVTRTLVIGPNMRLPVRVDLQ